MNRMKTYDVPHKGLRNALSQFSLLAGKTNYTDGKEVKELYMLGKDIFSILTIHAADEDEITLAELEIRCPGCSAHDTKDHKIIHEAQELLEKQLADLYAASLSGIDVTDSGNEFYLSLSEFHGKYLEHTAEEERVTQPLLWAHFSDEELALHRQKIMEKNPPETLLIWFRFVLPAQSPAERVALLSGFKKMADPEFFAKGLEVIKKELSPNEFLRLEKDLQ